MRGGDGVPWPAAGADFFGILLFSWEFGVLAAMHASGAMRVASDWLLALSRLCLLSLARMGSQEGPRTFSGQRQRLSLGPANLVV